MNYKKILGIITIFIVVMFILMLSSSYAWYSFSNGRTEFSAETNNDDITITYNTGMYIDTNIAVPISSSDVEDYAEKSLFSIDVNSSALENNIAVTIDLIEISIDTALVDSNFKYELLLDDELITSGNFGSFSGTTLNIASGVDLDSLNTNEFELRLYILDDNSDQNEMMNKTFQGTISINVVSRLKTNIEESGADILIKSITVDDTSSSYIPTTGYYTMTATCDNGSILSWNPLTKTITYSSGSKVNDSCSLIFTSNTDYPTLTSIAEPGDYVSYSGNNGCEGTSCKGENANYSSDTNMGYCSSSNYKFTTNGWRVGYISDSTAYLISAGSPDCYGTYIETVATSTAEKTLTQDYYYGSGYKFNSSTGAYELTGVITLSWSTNYENIINYTPYTCRESTSCTELYKVESYASNSTANVYIYTISANTNSETHLNSLDSESLKYCNSNYAYRGTCDSSSAWNMNDTDFQKITSSTLSNCLSSRSNMSCGYNNDLIDNGGYYWLDYYSSSVFYYWHPNSYIDTSTSSNKSYGIRPVLRLASTVYITGGSGTYDDPYIIDN